MFLVICSRWLLNNMSIIAFTFSWVARHLTMRWLSTMTRILDTRQLTRLQLPCILQLYESCPTCSQSWSRLLVVSIVKTFLFGWHEGGAVIRDPNGQQMLLALVMMIRAKAHRQRYITLLVVEASAVFNRGRDPSTGSLAQRWEHMWLWVACLLWSIEPQWGTLGSRSLSMVVIVVV